jgi:hypothetical protein
MAPRWAKADLKKLKAALRVLREEDAAEYDAIVSWHCGTIAKLLLEPRHAIQQRSAELLEDEVEQAIEEAIA